MKKVAGMTAFMLLAALILSLSACAAAEVMPEATEMPRPPAEQLTESMDALELTEEPAINNFRAVTLTGETVDQSIFADHKVTMINIWGTFCNPCIAEMPDLAALNTAYEEGEFQVVGLVIDMLDGRGAIHPGAVEAAWAIVDVTGANYMHLLPADDLIVAKLQYVTAVPETLFVDAQGNILNEEQYLGARSYEEWKTIADEMLALADAQAAQAE